jgi:hypothetical protein
MRPAIRSKYSESETNQRQRELSSTAITLQSRTLQSRKTNLPIAACFGQNKRMLYGDGVVTNAVNGELTHNTFSEFSYQSESPASLN